MSKKLNITFCSFPDFSGNAKALYEYMKKRYKNDMNFTWIIYNKENVDKLSKKNINVILIGTAEFKKYIKTTDVFFTTQGNLDGDKTKKSIYIELWHGIGPKPVGYLCNHPSEDDIKGYNNIRKIVDYIMVPNDFWKVVYSAIFHIEPSRIKSLGMPLLTYFDKANGKDNLKKIGIDYKKYKKIIMFMPTYKKGFNHNDVKKVNLKNVFNFEEYDENILNNYLCENNYLLLVKRHPGEQMINKETQLSNIINVDEKKLINQNLSINELINAFDLLITDYSSIGTEFIYLKKPVLYVINDLAEYIKERGIIFSNFDFWCAGPQVDNITDCVKEMNKLLIDNNYYRNERLKCYDLWFNGMPKNPSKAICDFIFYDNQIRKDFQKYISEEEKLQDRINQLEKEKEIDYNNHKKVVEKFEKEKEIDYNNHKQAIENLEKDKINLTNELKRVYNSNSWKIISMFRKIKHGGSKK